MSPTIFSITFVTIPVDFICHLLLAVSLTPSHGGFDGLLLALTCYYPGYINVIESQTGQCYSMLAFWTNLIGFFYIVLFLNLTALLTMKLEEETKIWGETTVWVCIPIKVCH